MSALLLLVGLAVLAAERRPTVRCARRHGLADCLYREPARLEVPRG